MKPLFRWSGRIIILSLGLLCAGWVFEESSQWRFRWQAERLLADLKTIQVGHSSTESESVLRKWVKRGDLDTGCGGDNGTRCYSNVRIMHLLPEVLRASPDDKAKNWLPRILDSLGLRDSMAGAGVITENGVIYLMGLVTQKEGDLAASVAQSTGGAQRVVKAFEYID